MYYSTLPDMIFQLSQDPDFETKDLRKVSRTLLKLVQKQTETEELIAKFTSMLQNTTNTALSRDILFCLTQLRYSHRNIITLVKVGQEKILRDTFTDPYITKYFQILIKRYKKIFPKELASIALQFDNLNLIKKTKS